MYGFLFFYLVIFSIHETRFNTTNSLSLEWVYLVVELRVMTSRWYRWRISLTLSFIANPIECDQLHVLSMEKVTFHLSVPYNLHGIPRLSPINFETFSYFTSFKGLIEIFLELFCPNFSFFPFFLPREKGREINKFDAAHRHHVARVNTGEVGSYISGKEKFLLLEKNFFHRAQFICRAENCRTFVTLKNRGAHVGIYWNIFKLTSHSPADVATYR